MIESWKRSVESLREFKVYVLPVLRKLSGPDADVNPSTATLLWSAKESAFKAWCTGLDADLDHVDPRDIHIELLDTDAAAFVAQATGLLGERVAAIGPLRGCYTRVDDVVITLAWRAAAGAR